MKKTLEIGAMEVFFTLLFEPAAKISITLALILRMSFATRKPWNALKKRLQIQTRCVIFFSFAIAIPRQAINF